MFTFTVERLRALIPNVIHEAPGEYPLNDKLAPWIEAESQWLESTFLGPDLELSPGTSLHVMCEKVIVYRAFAAAVPSLDLTLSPAGFAVIDTEGRAPASKERVERLIASVRESADALLPALLNRLTYLETWRKSAIAQWWLGSLFPSLDEAAVMCPKGTDLFKFYRQFRGYAVEFERRATEELIGHNLMTHLRTEQLSPAVAEPVSLLREVAVKYIHGRFDGHGFNHPNAMWHLVRPFLNELNYFPALKQMWQDEMSGSFNLPGFQNTTRGAFYF